LWLVVVRIRIDDFVFFLYHNASPF
jgi:hypothetical protein